jgi:Tol biopolymer transport system component
MKRTVVAVAAAVTTLFVAPASAAASAVNGYLAVDDGATGQIYRLTQLGTDLTQLTHVSGPGEFAFAPHWSPDGRRIAFERHTGGLFRMYTMAFDGSDMHAVLADAKRWDDSAVSYLDNDRLLFSRCHRNGTGCSIAIVNVDGTDLQLITHTGFEEYDFAPLASPDGTRISFIRYNTNGIHAQAWVMNTDGSAAHPVTGPALEAFTARWSPDGGSLLVSSNCCRLGGDLYSVTVPGGARTRITHTPYPNFSGIGDYAPSGREIAFLSDRNYPDKCCIDLFVMRSDGVHQVKVPTGLSGIGSVDWGPSPYA